MSLELDATAAQSPETVTDAGRAPRGEGLRIGSMLAHFRIDERIGGGGMGDVYRATDLALDRPVAIKVLPSGVAHDPGRRDRLFREARAQARLQHPNVCHIYYVGVQDGVVFFAMELVGGESLAERLARGPVPADEAVELVRQAALGLREAHRHGFTHRDVKPSNLMVDREGRVKVVDFGLVKVSEETAEPDPDPAKTGVVGTPLYMAPEQASGGDIDARADIYALGATLYHLVSGRPPFVADSQAELAAHHREAPRPKLAARALANVDAICARMMAKRAADRYASYDELIGELERISPARTRPAGFWVRAIATSIDLLVIGLFTLLPVEGIASAFGYQVESENLVLIGAIVPYVVLCTWRKGMTLGRWLLDIEVVEVAGMRRPSLRTAIIRCAAELGPVFGAMILSVFARTFGIEWLSRVSSFFGFLGILWGFDLLRASVRTPDKRTVWDRAAGTMVRYRGRA